MNAVSYLWGRFQGLGFEKRPQQDCASAIVETVTSTASTARCSVAAAAVAAVCCDTPVSASRAGGSACDSRPGASAISPARWIYAAARPRRSPLTRSRTFVAVAVYY